MDYKYNKGDTVSFVMPGDRLRKYGFIKNIETLNDFHDSILSCFYETSTSNGNFVNENKINGIEKILLIEKYV